MSRLHPGLVIICTLLLACDGGSIGSGGGGGNRRGPDGAQEDGGPPPSWPEAGSVDTTPSPDLLISKPEQCNGFDDDLDGKVDEDCPCKKGDTQACYPSQAKKVQGACKKGTQTCEPTGEFGKWGKCTGAVLPTKEKCGDTVDQDCNGTDLKCPVKTHCDYFTMGVNTRPVDIVWVIDQSGSMGGEINSVRNNMNLFASYISKAKVDYRVILVASRYYDKDNHQVCIPQPLAGANCADATRFKQIDQHVDSHDALARLLQYIGTIEKFMRPGSVRRFVAITDDDAEKVGWTAFHAALKLRKGYSDYKFHSIVALVDKGCAADDGKHYIALSNLTGGIKAHICNANWSSLFTSLAQEATSATNKLLLKKTPKKGTIKITIDGKPATEGTHWSHDASINQIIIKQPYPKNGQKIKVCYEM